MAGQYGDVTQLAPKGVGYVDQLLEHMTELAEEECGDPQGDWPVVSDEAKAELEKGLDTVICDWMRKHLKMPAWDPVTEAEKIPGERDGSDDQA